MGYSGINLESVKARNRTSILKLLNSQGAMSRKDIASVLGLSPASVTVLCSELLEEGMLYELGQQEENKVGRKKILLNINENYRYVLAVRIEAGQTNVSLCDLRGRCLGSRYFRNEKSASPEKLLSQAADACRELIWKNSIGREKLLGVGVTVPGPVDRTLGISSHAYRIWDFPVKVVEQMEEQLGCPVLLENNVKAFALAEQLYGIGRQKENLVILKWGPGVGSAIIARNHIYESRKFKTAEIGHVRVCKGGKLCRCGRRGCLETVVASHPIANHLRQVFDPVKTPLLWQTMEGDPERITVHTLADITALDDAGVWQALDEDMNVLTNVVGGILTMLVPDELVLYGDMFRLPHILEHFTEQCKAYDPHYDEHYIHLSALNEKIEYIGALAVVVSERFFQDQQGQD